VRKLLKLLFFSTLITTYAQEIEPIDYLFPVNPGQQNYLAGTVGEIRRSHFHTGIDVKTGGRTGLPIHAVADGFVSRIKVSASGYGNAIYLKHPNGTFSVYAHLEAFDPEIDKWILEQQYLEESFEVDLFPQKDQFEFKRGDIIAYTGNTGSSSGPHLHFEIRDSDHHPIDILTFGFDEIKDRIPPVVKKIAFVTLDEKARVNGYFGRHEFHLIKKDGIFTTSVPVYLSGKVGIEIYSYDPMDGIPNRNGIAKTTLLIDGEKKFGEHKKEFSFSKQRNALVHYNYEAAQTGSRRFNKLYLSDGNEQSFYTEVNRGINFQKQSIIEITTTDSYNNSSTTKIDLAKEPMDTKPWVNEIDKEGNFLHFRSDQSVSLLLDVWTVLRPYRSSGKDNYYVWDLRKGTPSSVFINGKTIKTNYVSTLPPNQKISYVQQEFDLNLSHRSLFDTLYLAFEKEYDSVRNLELFHFKNPTQPLRSNAYITLKPIEEYHIDAAVYSVFGKRLYYQGGDWDNDEITFSTRDLVTYTIARDSIKPSISPRVINTNDLKFRIDDDLSGIKSFRAELDGKFVLMYYEPKRKIIWSKKLDKNIPFEGEFILEVIDNSNNKSTYSKKL